MKAIRWTIVGYMNHIHDIACRYSWCCFFCRPHLVSNEIHHHGGLGKNSSTPHSFTSQKRFIYSQTDHKMRGFILALLCNTCSQEWGSEIKRESVQGPAPEREVVYQAANQAANLQLCLLSARLPSQRNHTHSAALSRIFELLVLFFSKGFKKWRLRTSDCLRQHKDSELCYDVTWRLFLDADFWSDKLVKLKK